MTVDREVVDAAARALYERFHPTTVAWEDLHPKLRAWWARRAEAVLAVVEPLIREKIAQEITTNHPAYMLRKGGWTVDDLAEFIRKGGDRG